MQNQNCLVVYGKEEKQQKRTSDMIIPVQRPFVTTGLGRYIKEDNKYCHAVWCIQKMWILKRAQTIKLRKNQLKNTDCLKFNNIMWKKVNGENLSRAASKSKIIHKDKWKCQKNRKMIGINMESLNVSKPRYDAHLKLPWRSKLSR